MAISVWKQTEHMIFRLPVWMFTVFPSISKEPDNRSFSGLFSVSKN